MYARRVMHDVLRAEDVNQKAALFYNFSARNLRNDTFTVMNVRPSRMECRVSLVDKRNQNSNKL